MSTPRVTRRTRWSDEATRVKDAYERLMELATHLNPNDRETFNEVIRELAGYEPGWPGRVSGYDPDLHYVNRAAAYRWMKDTGYIG